MIVLIVSLAEEEEETEDYIFILYVLFERQGHHVLNNVIYQSKKWQKQTALKQSSQTPSHPPAHKHILHVTSHGKTLIAKSIWMMDSVVQNRWDLFHCVFREQSSSITLKVSYLPFSRPTSTSF